MASRTRTLPHPATSARPFPAGQRKTDQLPGRISGQILNRVMVPGRTTDIVLYHHESDKSWCKQLAERIREQPKGNRHFATQLAAWNFSNSAALVSEAEKWLRTSRFFCLVISKPMLRENWPALEKLISVLSELGL